MPKRPSRGRTSRTAQLTATPPSVSFQTQMKRVRQTRGWTQQDLSEALDRLGIPDMDPSKIAKIENHHRDIRLDEALAIAAALGVCPLHLFVPLEKNAPVLVAPKLVVKPEVARRWVRGHAPLRAEDMQTFYSEVPRGERFDLVVQKTKTRGTLVHVYQRASDPGRESGYLSYFRISAAEAEKHKAGVRIDYEEEE